MKVEIGKYPEKCMEKQKIKVKIDAWDTWSMDYTLAHIVLPMLKQLKKTKHGAPMVDYKDVPKKLRPTKEEAKLFNYDGSTDKNFFKRWDWVMDEMIYAFDFLVNDGESQFDDWGSPEYKKAMKRSQRGFKFFGKYYRSLWD